MLGTPLRLPQKPSTSGVQEATVQLQAAMQQLQAELEQTVAPKYLARSRRFRARFAAKLLRRQQKKG